MSTQYCMVQYIHMFKLEAYRKRKWHVKLNNEDETDHLRTLWGTAPAWQQSQVQGCWYLSGRQHIANSSPYHRESTTHSRCSRRMLRAYIGNTRFMTIATLPQSWLMIHVAQSGKCLRILISFKAPSGVWGLFCGVWGSKSDEEESGSSERAGNHLIL